MQLIHDPLFYLAAAFAVTLLGLAKGGFSGVGALAMPLLTLVMPPLQAAAVMQPILIFQDAIAIFVYRRQWSGWNLLVMLPGAAIGIGVAWAVAAYVSDAAVQLAIGVIGFAFVLRVWFGRVPKEAKKPNAASGMFWGALSGFTSTLAQAGSPPYQMHILPQRLDKMSLVGTTTIFFACVNLMKLVPYSALGQFTPVTLGTSLALIPFAFVTNMLGIWLVRRVPTELFYRIAYVLVFLISLELMRRGALGLWHGG